MIVRNIFKNINLKLYTKSSKISDFVDAAKNSSGIAGKVMYDGLTINKIL